MIWIVPIIPQQHNDHPLSLPGAHELPMGGESWAPVLTYPIQSTSVLS